MKLLCVDCSSSALGVMVILLSKLLEAASNDMSNCGCLLGGLSIRTCRRR